MSYDLLCLHAGSSLLTLQAMAWEASARGSADLAFVKARRRDVADANLFIVKTQNLVLGGRL